MTSNLFGVEYKSLLHERHIESAIAKIDTQDEFHDLLYTVASYMIKTGCNVCVVSSKINLEVYGLKLLQIDFCRKYYRVKIEDVLRLIDQDIAVSIIKYRENQLDQLRGCIPSGTKSARNV